MKTKKLNQKLVLNKRTVANLNDDEMKKLRGGLIGHTELGTNCASCTT